MMITVPPRKPNDAFFDQLRKLGLRPTSARLDILRALNGNPREALSAERLFVLLSDQGAGTSLGTIYRVLNELELRGIVHKEWRSQNAMAKACYRLASSAAISVCHFLCPSCGHRHPINDATILAALSQLALKHGFEQGMADASISCVCNQCSAG
jgi:Fur family ferric uptake transcriptional regulator